MSLVGSLPLPRDFLVPQQLKKGPYCLHDRDNVRPFWSVLVRVGRKLYEPALIE